MKVLRNAGIATVAGLALIVIYVLIVFMIVSPKIGDEVATNNVLKTLFSPLILSIGSLISIVVLILIFSGFISLGKRFDNKALVVISWAFLILLISNTIYSTVSISIKQNPLDKFQIDDTLDVVFLLLLSAMMIMLGVSLFLFKNKVILSKVGGILYLSTGVFFISIILDFLGVYTYIAAIIIQSIIFFNTSKKLEK